MKNIEHYCKIFYVTPLHRITYVHEKVTRIHISNSDQSDLEALPNVFPARDSIDAFGLLSPIDDSTAVRKKNFSYDVVIRQQPIFDRTKFPSFIKYTAHSKKCTHHSSTTYLRGCMYVHTGMPISSEKRFQARTQCTRVGNGNEIITELGTGSTSNQQNFLLRMANPPQSAWSHPPTRVP